MYSKRKGFTLIELLVVIAILAVLTLYVISSTRTQGQISAEERATVEMKYWLEAAMAYYVVNEKWPTNLSQLAPAYLPEKVLCTPWLDNAAGTAVCGKHSQYTGTIGKNSLYYTVTATAPDNTTAKRVAARLPQSEVNNKQVSSSVGIPGSYKGWIASAGIAANEDVIYLPKCPNGFEGHFFQAPQYVTTGFKVNTELGYGDVVNPTTTSPSVKAHVHVHSDNSKKYRSSYYMTVCVPSGKWVPQKNTTNGADVNQCSPSWLQYNGNNGTPC